MDLERERNHRWSGVLKRWRWPSTGKDIAGDGGSFSFRLDFVSKNLAEIKRKREERIKIWMRSILFCMFVCSSFLQAFLLYLVS